MGPRLTLLANQSQRPSHPNLLLNSQANSYETNPPITLDNYELVQRLPESDVLGECLIIYEKLSGMKLCVKVQTVSSPEEMMLLSSRLLGFSSQSKSSRQSVSISNSSTSPSMLSVYSVLKTRVDKSQVWQILYALEYVDQNLCDYSSSINSKGTFKESDIWTLLSQVSLGLIHLSRQGKNHGDLRSRSIFITPKGEYKIADRDFTQAASTFERVSIILKGKSISLSNTLSGYYLAPEQFQELNNQIIRSQCDGSKLDSFSLGCIALELMRRSIGDNPGYLDEMYSWGGFGPLQTRPVMSQFHASKLEKILQSIQDKGLFSKQLISTVAALVLDDPRKRMDLERLEREARDKLMPRNTVLQSAKVNQAPLVTSLNNRTLVVNSQLSLQNASNKKGFLLGILQEELTRNKQKKIITPKQGTSQIGLLRQYTSMSDLHEEQLQKMLEIADTEQYQRHLPQESQVPFRNMTPSKSLAQMNQKPASGRIVGLTQSQMDLSNVHARTASIGQKAGTIHTQQENLLDNIEQQHFSNTKQTNLYRDFLKEVQSNRDLDPHLSISSVTSYVQKKKKKSIDINQHGRSIENDPQQLDNKENQGLFLLPVRHTSFEVRKAQPIEIPVNSLQFKLEQLQQSQNNSKLLSRKSISTAYLTHEDVKHNYWIQNRIPKRPQHLPHQSGSNTEDVDSQRRQPFAYNMKQIGLKMPQIGSSREKHHVSMSEAINSAREIHLNPKEFGKEQEAHPKNGLYDSVVMFTYDDTIDQPSPSPQKYRHKKSMSSVLYPQRKERIQSGRGSMGLLDELISYKIHTKEERSRRSYSGVLSSHRSLTTQRSNASFSEKNMPNITRDNFSIKLPSSKVLEEVVKNQDFLNNCVNGNKRSANKIIRENYENGAYYEGEAYGMMREGQGKFVHSNGERYEGDWVLGEMSGFGRYYYNSGCVAYEGSWKNNLFEGRGKLFNDTRLIYPKTTSVNFNDLGTIGHVWSEFDGEFKENQKDGYGTYYFIDGSKFAGNFQGDQASGIGSFIFPSNNKSPITGEWRKNVLVHQLL